MQKHYLFTYIKRGHFMRLARDLAKLSKISRCHGTPGVKVRKTKLFAFGNPYLLEALNEFPAEAYS